MARRRIDVGEITLSVCEEGAGGDVVVLLHGFPELSHSWRHQLPALAGAGYHAVAPDLRGYGDSTPPPRSPTTRFPSSSATSPA